jgi:hypothetical protein
MMVKVRIPRLGLQLYLGVLLLIVPAGLGASKETVYRIALRSIQLRCPNIDTLRGHVLPYERRPRFSFNTFALISITQSGNAMNTQVK